MSTHQRWYYRAVLFPINGDTISPIPSLPLRPTASLLYHRYIFDYGSRHRHITVTV
ncbi:hypothetical protein JWG39_11525 [Desulforhopalus vacuolatus]|uniref:hypothetical protein n=1 Tax=Desulforhopalus vacuolatus TaxID=40414 RepID=UPI001966925B|nr:hypothetical protein [Desulforhopalus vacuolatus]MBM9520443.1 hypothetical protein [Desulforhopalus vacuolatus]